MDNVVEIRDLETRFGHQIVHQGLNLDIRRGEILGIVGGSGSGKTTLIRVMLALSRPTVGSIKVFGTEITTASYKTLLQIQQRWGVLFQQSALFSSINLLDNVAFPLKEHTSLDQDTIYRLARLKILMAGLPVEAAVKFPAQLSGGMQKRAGLARALILDPELVILDEPTSGLDPNTAAAFDDLILNLQSTMGLTIVMVTHDVDSLWKVTDRVAFLGRGKVLCVDDMATLVKNSDPMIQSFFHGPRGRLVEAAHLNGKH